MYTCPVCGYNQLRYPPRNENICPSCYTEFGYDDATKTHDELRAEWLANGAHWEGMNVMPPPAGWNPFTQLANLEKARPTSREISSTVSANVFLVGRLVEPEQARLFSRQVRFQSLEDLIAAQATCA